ncbi:MAG: hypothetical protein KJO18_02180 [Acidimicrobiia bacterium]|nr:hypothetical protein [Acidimicrobiia bacterium]
MARLSIWLKCLVAGIALVPVAATAGKHPLVGGWRVDVAGTKASASLGRGANDAVLDMLSVYTFRVTEWNDILRIESWPGREVGPPVGRVSRELY